jgi:hypothetical protein
VTFQAGFRPVNGNLLFCSSTGDEIEIQTDGDVILVDTYSHTRSPLAFLFFRGAFTHAR